MRSADITPGYRIGELVALEKTVRVLTSGRRMPAWWLVCDCGAQVVAMTVNITKGKHMSCGCARSRPDPDAVTRKPEYRVYRQMLDRCYLPTALNYSWYGGQGVSVCDRWRFGSEGKTGFECFISDMGRRPPRLTLDRKDPRLPYSPDNCRWASWTDQAANKREHYLSAIERATLAAKRSHARRGEKSPVAKLTEVQVARMKSLIAAGERTSVLAAMFGVAPQTVSGIKAGRKWSHVRPA